MYARKDSLAIDGKAMYFGGEKRISDLGLRPSDFKPHEISQGFDDRARNKIKDFDPCESVKSVAGFEVRGPKSDVSLRDELAA
jgi:hypothetical protein